MIAYLDPFTGSLVLQALATGFVAVLAFFRPLYNLVFGKKNQTDKALDDWNDAESVAGNNTENSDKKDGE